MVTIRQFGESTVILAGLSWDITEKATGRMEARSKAKAAEAHAVLVRGGERNVAMAQLPSKSHALLDQRIVAFAGALDDAVDAEKWCGVFEFEQQFVYVASVDKRILPDGDTVYPSIDEAKARLASEYELFETIYAPRSWAYADTIATNQNGKIDRWSVLDAESLVAAIDWSAIEAMQSLREKSAVNPKMVLLGCVATLAVLGVGFQYWSSQKAEKERIEREKRAKAPPPPPIPWLDQSKPLAAYAACQSLRGDMADLGHYGWKAESLDCDFKGKKFSAFLVPFLTQPLPPVTRPGFTVAWKNDGSGITVSGSLVPPKGSSREGEKGSFDNTLKARSIVVTYGDTGSSWGVEGDRHKFSLTLKAQVQEVAQRLNALPTLSLNRMEYSGDQWRVEGELFQK